MPEQPPVLAELQTAHTPAATVSEVLSALAELQTTHAPAATVPEEEPPSQAEQQKLLAEAEAARAAQILAEINGNIKKGLCRFRFERKKEMCQKKAEYEKEGFCAQHFKTTRDVESKKRAREEKAEERKQEREKKRKRLDDQKQAKIFLNK